MRHKRERGPIARAGATADHVADGIAAHVCEAVGAQAAGNLFGARIFFKSRGGNFTERNLLFKRKRGLFPGDIECARNGRIGGKRFDAGADVLAERREILYRHDGYSF